MRNAVSGTFAVLLLLSANQTLAWGPDGHKTVGRVASLRINSHTSEAISHILKSGETLGGIATWADDVKDRVGQHDSDSDTNAFLQDQAHNRDNREWHFDDLPLNCGSYDTCNGFTLSNDVVHIINVSVRTLQGHPDSSHPLSKRNALRLLVHLVGDLHQPLHVGSGYINANGPNHAIIIEMDPVKIQQGHLPKDVGANNLVIDSQNDNLHSFWDTTLVRAVMQKDHKSTVESLSQFLKSSVTPQSNWNPEGAVSTWASQWATDSLHVSHDHAYATVSITGTRTIQDHGHSKKVFVIKRGTDYKDLNTAVVREQLAKAGFRLAKLLDAIFATT